MEKYHQSCPKHPDAEIIPGLEACYCYICKKWIFHPEQKQNKWNLKTQTKKRNQKNKEIINLNQGRLL